MPSLASSAVIVALGRGSSGVARGLAGSGIDVRLASTGLQVVSSLWPRGDELSCPPSLMVLAAFLPGYNGLSILAGIRSLGWRTPVILSWPSLHPWIRDEAMRLGVVGLFEEPVDSEEVCTAIARELAGQAQSLGNVRPAH